jgi:spore maturation protein SpmA/spore maturation protein SpmB
LALQRIWISLFVLALIATIGSEIQEWNLPPTVSGESGSVDDVVLRETAFQKTTNSVFSSAKVAMNILLGLCGVMAFWLGLLKIAEKAGMVDKLAKIISPVLGCVFPDIPKDSKAFGPLTLNIAANMLGLGNSATPFGIKAMEELQEHNPNKSTASNSQIMFLVLNTSGITLIPVSVLAVRTSSGSVDPTAVFVPILLATFASTIVGVLITSIVQKINLFRWPIIKVLLIISGLSSMILLAFTQLGQMLFASRMSSIGNFVIYGIVVFFLLYAAYKKRTVFNDFIEGAKESIDIIKRILPYLVAMLVAVGVFKASGALDYVVKGLALLLPEGNFWDGVSSSLPVAIMRPFSGGGAESLMISNMETHGADSFIGLLSSTFQGTTETTFYVIALYFGAVGIKNIRYAAWAGLAADCAGMIAAIVISYYFYFS